MQCLQVTPGLLYDDVLYGQCLVTLCGYLWRSVSATEIFVCSCHFFGDPSSQIICLTVERRDKEKYYPGVSRTVLSFAFTAVTAGARTAASPPPRHFSGALVL